MFEYMVESPDTENQNVTEAAISWEMINIWNVKNNNT